MITSCRAALSCSGLPQISRRTELPFPEAALGQGR